MTDKELNDLTAREFKTLTAESSFWNRSFEDQDTIERMTREKERLAGNVIRLTSQRDDAESKVRGLETSLRLSVNREAAIAAVENWSRAQGWDSAFTADVVATLRALPAAD